MESSVNKQYEIEHISEFVDLLNHYRDLYYNHSTSKISDEVYDRMFDKLKELEKRTGIIMTNSPTQTVGYEVKSNLRKVKHTHLMLSLDKTKNVSDLVEFSKNKDCVVSLKMDGLTVLLTYDNGQLIRAETRGNGEVGEDITHNARVFTNIPLRIPDKGYCEFEGEAIITYDDFEAVNSKLPKDERYKNPRNLASGSVRQLDSKIAAQRNIKFVVWKVPTAVNTSMVDALWYAQENGFTTVPYSYVTERSNADSYNDIIGSLKLQAEYMRYPIDGLVITYDDINYGLSLGMTGHHPKHSLAYKFYDEEVETVITAIDWSVGKTGMIIPTAVFNPVEIDGTVVERASVHNVSVLTALDLHIGDRVTVYKANKIIPQIKRNINAASRYIEVPGKCPICGGKAEIMQSGETKILTCANNNCGGKKIGKFCYFASKNAMNIDGLSESTLEKFVNRNYIKKFSDVYKLKRYYKEIIRLDGFGKKSADNLMAAIEKSKHTTLDRFINALCIPMIGKENAKLIAEHCGYNIDTFINLMSQRNYEWSLIDGIGDIVMQNINYYSIDYFDDIKELASYLIFENTVKNKQTDLSGKIFVITGKLNRFTNRDELVEVIERHGGKVTETVSKKTDFLINNDSKANSGKNKKAVLLNIKIITEEDFFKMIGN